MFDSRRRRATRGNTERQAVVVEPPMTLVMGAMALGLFVGALLAPDATTDGDVVQAGIAAVDRLVSRQPE